MKLEHIALNVVDPEGMAAWYVKNLGMCVTKQAGKAFFIADDSGAILLELYQNPKAPTPDYGSVPPQVFHVAFVSTDVEADVQRLLNEGAKEITPVEHTQGGDVIGMLRDPWGVALQFIKRSTGPLCIPDRF